VTRRGVLGPIYLRCPRGPDPACLTPQRQAGRFPSGPAPASWRRTSNRIVRLQDQPEALSPNLPGQSYSAACRPIIPTGRGGLSSRFITEVERKLLPAPTPPPAFGQRPGSGQLARGPLLRSWVVLDHRSRRGEEQTLALVLPLHQVWRFAVLTVDFNDPAVPVCLALPDRLHCEGVTHCSLHGYAPLSGTHGLTGWQAGARAEGLGRACRWSWLSGGPPDGAGMMRVALLRCDLRHFDAISARIRSRAISVSLCPRSVPGDRVADHHDRASGVVDTMLTGRAEQSLDESAEATVANDQQVGSGRLFH
jgi:hypothetical protein